MGAEAKPGLCSWSRSVSETNLIGFAMLVTFPTRSAFLWFARIVRVPVSCTRSGEETLLCQGEWGDDNVRGGSCLIGRLLGIDDSARIYSRILDRVRTLVHGDAACLG